MDRRLKDVADVRFSNVDKISRAGETPVRLCNYTDVYNNDYITSGMEFMEATASHSEIAKFGLRVGDVLLTKDSETPNDIGIPTVVDETADGLVCGYHLALIRPDRKRVDPTYLSKQLAHYRIAGYFGQQANGSTRYGLSTSSIEQAPLELPRIEDQVAIGRILRLVDETIQKTEAVIAKLKQIRAGMLHDLLTYGLDKDGKLRDPVAHPEQFKDSELGRIPKEWEVTKCRSALGLKSGVAKTQSELLKEGKGSVPVYGGNGVTGYTQVPLVTSPTVVIGRVGEYCGKVQLTPERAWITDNALYVTELTSACTMTFLHCYLDWRDLTKLQSATGQPLVTQTGIGETSIALPRSQEQAAIVSALQSFDNLMLQQERDLCKLRHLKCGLMDDLLSGTVLVLADLVAEGVPA